MQRFGVRLFLLNRGLQLGVVPGCRQIPLRDARQVDRACLAAGWRSDPGQRHEAVRLVQVCDRLFLPKFLCQRVAIPDEEGGGGVRAGGLVFGDVLLLAPACFFYPLGDAAAEGVIELVCAVA